MSQPISQVQSSDEVCNQEAPATLPSCCKAVLNNSQAASEFQDGGTSSYDIPEKKPVKKREPLTPNNEEKQNQQKDGNT
jgi:hypothetical protein